MLKNIARRARVLLPMSLRRWVQRAGDFLVDAHRFPSVQGSLAALRDRGFRPRTCIDIGAFQGDWARMFRSVFPGSKVLMIDALQSQAARLHEVSRGSDGSLTYEIALLSSSPDKEVMFHEMETGSSVFAESSPYPRQARSLTTQTLDDLVRRRAEFRRPDFLKLDTQGYELEVLKGAGETLLASQAVFLETSLIPVNVGCPLIAEVVAFMSDHGFNLYDFCSQVRRGDGVLWQTDLLFLNRASGPIPKPELTHENWF